MKTFLLVLLFPVLAFAQSISNIDAQGNRTTVTPSGDLSMAATGAFTLATGWSKLSVTGVNAKATGAATIGTTANNGLNFHPIFAFVESTAATSITIVAALSIGTNSTSFNNVLAITAVTGVSSANTFLQANLATAVNSVIAPNTVVKVNITTAATGTSQTLSITLFGYYQ